MNKLPAFDFQQYERDVYAFWLSHDSFKADAKSPKPAYTIVIPPPNVTGVLHMGHALDNTLQDILIRFKRMDGFNALWVPGTDHAGIATQAVVEKQLAQEGLSRIKMGKEAFLKRVWDWKKQSGSLIIEQLKRLGASCDWSRERFTMDEGLSLAVKKCFVSLYQEGLIYRSSYLINFSPALKSAVSDLEVEYKEIQGQLYHFNYQSKDHKHQITVATTRPETMLGDSAIAVHPDDKKYAHLIGQTFAHPFIDREIPLIADDGVDPAFGTGAVKITPAHDPNDYQMGLKHQLPFYNVLDEDAKICDTQTPFDGLDRFEARKKIIEALKAKGLFVKQEAHVHKVGHCQRTNVIIEPRISKQWFVKIKPLAQKAIEVVDQGKIKFVPENWTKTYLHWMHNIQDWCISRQLWWGHQIPAWFCLQCDHITVSFQIPTACEKCKSDKIKQSEDVLDTWFSSALWPFSTLGWPNQTQDLKTFYPTSTLVTGFDIIFFWVARMIMMGTHFMKEVPFNTVCIHALVRDESGQKMSKSKGNVIDPLNLMQLYGTDAFRFALTAFAAQGRDILLSVKRIEGYRNFITKLYNASKYVLEFTKNDTYDSNLLSTIKPNTMAQQWILSRTQQVIKEVRIAIEQMRFNDAASSLYQFIWHHFCDWYIECAKVELKSLQTAQAAHQTLIYVLTTTLKLLHPICPFVTEHIYLALPLKKNESESILMTSSYPKVTSSYENENAQNIFERFQKLIDSLRQFRTENKIPYSKPIAHLHVYSISQNNIMEAVKDNKLYIQSLVNIQNIEFHQKAIDFTQAHSKLSNVEAGIEMIVPWNELIDHQAEIERIEKVLAKLQSDKLFIQNKLNNEHFVQKAPADLIAKQKEHLNLTLLEIVKNTNALLELKKQK